MTNQTEPPIEKPYEIYLANSKVALVDHVDWGLEAYSWSLDSNGYPRRRTPEDWIYMHIDIIGTKEGFLPDHKNRNPLDNRRDNLRFVTRGQNVVNSPKAENPTATSLYKGVSLDRERNKWVTSICHDGKKENLGRFSIEGEAAIAYNNAAIKYFGDAAFLNTVSDSGMFGGLDASIRKDEGSEEPANVTATQTAASSPTTKNKVEMPKDARKNAEQAYAECAFDYERDPMGSRDWIIFWNGWQAALQQREIRVLKQSLAKVEQYADRLESVN